mgnify:CR=1 FL=1
MKSCILVVLGLSVAAAYAAEPTPAELVERAKAAPCLLLTREQAKVVREKIANDRDAKTWWKSFSRQAAKRLKSATEVPDRGGQWSLWYNCRKCGAQMKYEDPKRHVCPKCGEVHTGYPYDDCYVMSRHYKLGEGARECGIAYLLTGDRAYADWIRSVLLGYAEKYAGYEWHTRMGVTGKPGGSAARLAAQVLDESVCLLGLLDGYDAIRSELSEADRRKIENDFIRQSVATIRSENAKWSNHECWHLSAYGLAGLVLGDVDLVDRAFNSEYGADNQFRHGILSDGCWWEVAMHYHLYTIDSFLPFYRAMANLGYRPPEVFRRMFQVPFDQVGPDGRFAAINDSWERHLKPGDYPAYFEMAYAWWGDDLFGWWVNQKPRDNIYYALWGRSGCPSAKMTFSSRLYDASGLAVLRTRTPGFFGETMCGMPDNCLMMDYGPHGKWHGHPDKLHLTFWGHGKMLAEDPGCMGYGNPLHWGWYKSTLAHNTIRIDGRNQKPAEGKLLGWTDKGNVVAVAADAGPIADGVTARRMSALVDDVLLDYLWVESETDHQYEWIFHGQGELTTSVSAEPVTGIPPHLEKLEKYGKDWSGEDSWSWVEKPRKGPHEGAWTATWTKKGVPLVQLVQRSSAGELWSGVGGALTPPRKTPFVVNRYRGKSAAFPSVITCGKAEVTLGKSFAEPDGTRGFEATVNGRRFILLYSASGVCRIGDRVWKTGLVAEEIQ